MKLLLLLLPMLSGGLVLTLFGLFSRPEQLLWSLSGVALLVICLTVWLTSAALGRR